MKKFTLFVLIAVLALASATSVGENSNLFPSLSDVGNIISQGLNISSSNSILSGSSPLIPGTDEIAAAVRISQNQITNDLCNNYVNGFITAFAQVVPGANPAAAALTITKTIADANIAIALNCPVINIGTRVLKANGAASAILNNDWLTYN